MSGIISYGYYVPRFRISVDTIAKMWGKSGDTVSASLGVREKAVAGIDEDSLTMAFESATMALRDAPVKAKDISSVFFGSESPVYAVNPTSTILGELLGVGNNYLAYDTQFACKAATGAAISALAHANADPKHISLVCASDKATAKTHDALEYTAASASVSLLIGQDNVIAEVLASASYSSDTPDFWRREGIRYPSHGGRFTGKPSYYRHIAGATQDIFDKTGKKPSDFAFAVFHMPNGKFPRDIAGSLGFEKEQYIDSLVVEYLGNSYTASALMGLVAVLEKAQAGDEIFFASYGSGAGSDAFVFKVTEEITKRRRTFRARVDEKVYIEYATYLKYMNII